MSEADSPSSLDTRVDLGLLSLETAPGWQFYPMRDRVIGRPANGVGGIHIVRLPLSSVAWPATHEVCMSAAIEASGQEVETPGSDRAREYGEQCLAGGESFHSGTDYVRIWYRHCPDGMIAAWFACKQIRMRERAVVDSVREADKMVATVRVAPPLA